MPNKASLTKGQEHQTSPRNGHWEEPMTMAPDYIEKF